MDGTKRGHEMFREIEDDKHITGIEGISLLTTHPV